MWKLNGEFSVSSLETKALTLCWPSEESTGQAWLRVENPLPTVMGLMVQ